MNLGRPEAVLLQAGGMGSRGCLASGFASSADKQGA